MEFQKISVPSPPPNTLRATKILREGGGGPKGDNFRGGECGVASRVFFFWGGEAPSKIDEQTNSDFAVNRCSKANINVFIDDLLLAVG